MKIKAPLLSIVTILCLVFSNGPTANAAFNPSNAESAAKHMEKLGIIKGKALGDLALNDTVTRAEMVTIIVRAFGQESNAALLNGAAAFPDTASHWASGKIAMAKYIVEKVSGSEKLGMPDGSFNPDGKMMPAQALAMMMKFLGIKPDATKSWPENYIDRAVELGLITSEDGMLLQPMQNDNVNRGLVFYLMDRAFG